MFLLALGYFRARQRFYRLGFERVRDDVEYLCRRYLDNTAEVTDLIGANEHESHYVFDMLFNNVTDHRTGHAFHRHARYQPAELRAATPIWLSLCATLSGFS